MCMLICAIEILNIIIIYYYYFNSQFAREKSWERGCLDLMPYFLFAYPTVNGFIALSDMKRSEHKVTYALELVISVNDVVMFLLVAFL